MTPWALRGVVLATAILSFTPPQGNTLAEQQRAAVIQGPSGGTVRSWTGIGAGTPFTLRIGETKTVPLKVVEPPKRTMK